jgi:hypothetical protein
MDDAAKVPRSLAEERITTIFPELISTIVISNHKRAFEGYMRFYGLDYIEDEGSIAVRLGDDGALHAVFDEQNRITKLESRGKMIAEFAWHVSEEAPDENS